MVRKSIHQSAWLSTPEEHDYPAAQSYLSLRTLPAKAAKLVKAPRKEQMTEFRAKDIGRPCGLSLIGGSNLYVECVNPL